MALQPGLLAPNSEFLPPSRALVVVSGLIHGASRKKGASGGTGVKGQDLEHLCLFFFTRRVGTYYYFSLLCFSPGISASQKQLTLHQVMQKSTNKVRLKALCVLQKNLYMPFSLIIELQRGKIKLFPSCVESFHPTCQ